MVEPATPLEEGSPQAGPAGGRRGRWGIAAAVILGAVLLLTVGLVAVTQTTSSHGPQSSTLAEIGMPTSASGAVSKAESIAALLASIGQQQGAAAEEAAATQAVDSALSTPAGRQALFDADTVLAGHAFARSAPGSRRSAAGAPVTSSRGLSIDGKVSVGAQLISAGSPELSVYYVNGVNTYYPEALAQRDSLEVLLGVDVTLVYNSSAKDLATMDIDVCTRALQASGLGDEQIALDMSWGEWLAEKANNALAAGLRGACTEIDAVGTLGVKALSVGHAVVSLAELAAQRFIGGDLASTQVNARLVPDIETDILDGKRVVVIGHSQGTMFTLNALEQVQAWWAQRQASGQVPAAACPGVDTATNQDALSSQRPVPMGVLHISPAFGSIRSANTAANEDIGHGAQRYVTLRGDVLFGISPLPPTADSIPGQIPPGPPPLMTHKLSTYMYRDSNDKASESRTQIGQRFTELSDYVTSLPGISAAPCETTSTTSTTNTTDTTNTTETPTTSADTSTSDTIASTDTTDTTPSTDTAPPTSDAGPASTTPSAADQTFSGAFIADPSYDPARRKFLTNTIQITVHGDGSADGSYSVSFTQNDTYLSPDVLPGCVQTFSASGTLKLAADGGGTGTIENLSEAAPSASGCWPGWTYSLRSKGGWRLNNVTGGRALGGVDVYAHAFAFNLGGG